jgi:hypothetical protein
MEGYRSRNGTNYDCIVPVIVEKNSTYQTIRILELRLIQQGLLGRDADWDDVTYYMFEKV